MRLVQTYRIALIAILFTTAFLTSAAAQEYPPDFAAAAQEGPPRGG
jgi:hypothetical protein